MCGVRLKSIDAQRATTAVTFRWINQNPFNSMFWAVQGMAAELSTGALVMSYIKKRGEPVSMLVANNKATFSKKAIGKIIFTCTDGEAIRKAIDAAILSGEGKTCWMRAEGKDRAGDVVSVFHFEWTVKAKSQKH